MSTYSPANTNAQWFAGRYPGARIKPNVVVLHTTETGNAWPGYGGGASEPNYSVRPNFRTKTLEWRAHFPDEMSSRALVNKRGGVETNTANAIQVELVGTCDSQYRTSRREWGKVGDDYLYWPDAPDWALEGVADFLRDVNKRHGIKLQAPAFKQYPSSYGNSSVRMSFATWRNFYGVCGHQHVPENDHGDPGDIDINKILAFAERRAPIAPKPGGAQSIPGSRPTSKPAPSKVVKAKAPAFPLPRGHYFGPKSGGAQSVSGHYSHRADLKRWQQQMRKRGWSLTADGLHGARTASVARSFQKEKGLTADSLIGEATWRAAWSEPVT